MWERLVDQNQYQGGMDVQSSRLSVPGGWIVRTVVTSGSGRVGVVQTFVEDANHSWKI
jgi:hypothetical protein